MERKTTKSIAEIKEQKILARNEAAKYIGISITGLNYAMQRPDFPPPIRIGARVFIDRMKLDAWIDAQTERRT